MPVMVNLLKKTTMLDQQADIRNDETNASNKCVALSCSFVGRAMPTMKVSPVTPG